MTTYTTTDGDVLDQIALAQMGGEDQVPALLAANPDLASQPEALPSGVVITIPDVATETTQSQIRLWGLS